MVAATFDEANSEWDWEASQNRRAPRVRRTAEALGRVPVTLRSNSAVPGSTTFAGFP